MSQSNYTAEEITRRGQKIYDQQLRDLVEPKYNGKFLVVDIGTGDYEIDTESITAADRLFARHPDAILYYVRVGYPAAHRLGGRLTVARS